MGRFIKSQLMKSKTTAVVVFLTTDRKQKDRRENRKSSAHDSRLHPVFDMTLWSHPSTVMVPEDKEFLCVETEW